jgi:hypothetical protein
MNICTDYSLGLIQRAQAAQQLVKKPEEMEPDELRDEIKQLSHALDTPGYFYQPQFNYLGDDRENVRQAFHYRREALEAELSIRSEQEEFPTIIGA